MEEIVINKIEWTAPEYNHEEKSMDFLWAIGVVAIVVCIVAIWFKNYIFSVFVLVSGATLILFSIRHPHEITFSVETKGLTMGKTTYPWKDIKGFHIKKENSKSVLIIELIKYFLPVYTIPLPIELVDSVRESLLKVIPYKELEESKSMKFMEKLGF